MKLNILLLVIVCFLTNTIYTLKVAPFIDFNNYFRSFENENFRTIEFQAIDSFKVGDELVAYMTMKSKFMTVMKEKTFQI